MFPNIFLVGVELGLRRITNQREWFKKMLMHGLIIYLPKVPPCKHPQGDICQRLTALLIVCVDAPEKAYTWALLLFDAEH